jgi:predicted TIM-barrel fold metal-dependent hydrolase
VITALVDAPPRAVDASPRAKAPLGARSAACSMAVLVAVVGAPVFQASAQEAPLAAAQESPPPIIDMHLHALAADSQGPPPQVICAPFETLPARDTRLSWMEVFAGIAADPPCANPLVSPMGDDEIMRRTLEILERRNIIGVTGGPLQIVERWKAAAPDRIIGGMSFALRTGAPTPEEIRELFEAGRLQVLTEVTNQYLGIEPDDPRFEPYLAMAEEIDLPVGIHIGTGPPGAPYLPGFGEYRARMHSPLSLEEPLLRHPDLRLYIMHAGWPMLDDTMALLWAHPQVYVEVGVIVYALPRAEFYRYLRTLVEAGFGNRVMFGSDQMVWPEAIEHAIESIESADFLSEAQKRDILYNNAARFLRLENTGDR